MGGGGGRVHLLHNRLLHSLSAELSFNVCGFTEEPVDRNLTVKLCTVGDSCRTSGPVIQGDVVH